MRLLRLDLLRYGHLTDVALEFPAGAALHVVHGPNEAGKSTALSAIADALFGFGHRTDRDFLHGAKNLRIGFTLEDGGGAAARFQRRKGRQATLMDAEDQPLPEDALRRFLGGAGRELFDRGFGLDGERLRAGGRDLLRSGGESGESLLAGMGLLHLRKALDKLEEEAKSLVGDGRGKRRFSTAMDEYQQARRAAEEAAVRPRDWEEAEAALAAILAELDRVQQAMGQGVAEASRLQRIRRVKPPLAALDAARAELAGLAAMPRLPAEAAETLRGATEAIRAARQDAEREAEAGSRLAAELAALPQDTAVLEVQDAIDTLADRRPLVLQAEADLPGIRAAVADCRARVEEAARQLGVAGPVEALRDRLPAEAVRRRAQRLIGERASLAARSAAAAEALGKALRQRDAAAAALQAMPAPASPVPLRRAVEAARGEGPLDRDLDQAERGLARARGATAEALAALPLWAGDAAALAACAVPLQAEAEAVARQLAEATAAAGRARDDLAALAAEIERLEAETADLAAGETVPTRAVVEAARLARDRAWRLLRDRAEGAGPPEEFEALSDAADRLADRRADEAQRVADYALRVDRLARARQRREAAVAGLAAADAAAAAAEAAWRALWAPAGLLPQRPEAMAEWRRARQAVLTLAAAEREAVQARDALAARREAARAALAGFLPAVPAGTALAPLLAAADDACTAAEAAAAAHRKLVEKLADAEAGLPEARDRAAAAERVLAELDADWAAVVAALGLAAGAGAAEVEAALGAWTRIAEAVPAWRTDAQRIADMEAECEGFAAALRAILARLPGTDTGEPPVVLALGLARRLAAARQARDAAAALAVRIEAHATAAATAERRRAAAERDITALRDAAGAADLAALEAMIDAAQRRDLLVRDVAALERVLAEQGDGHPEPTLRAEADAMDADAAQARLAAIDREQAESAARLGQLGGERATAEARLAGMRQGRDAAALAQAAEQALAEARGAAERYARVHLARRLLQAGIERFRAEQQTPLLRAAGTHFALLTGGRYARLLAEEDDKGRVLLKAIRDDGTDCAVEGLSEGTRDQLYLALRIASVEHHAAHAEPLPFIADDLLVHFDDTRAAAAIALLARLGQATQVVLFTHHDHIAALAARQPGVHLQILPGAAPGVAAARTAA
jgi:uncharacterized protein YhaN